MSGLALDTNAVSALFEGDAALLTLLEDESRLAMPVIVVGEYRFGLLRSRHKQKLAALLDELIATSDLLAIDDETATVYAETRERLRVRGKPLPENDVWIAALCRQHRRTLVSRDRHFAEVDGLDCEGW